MDTLTEETTMDGDEDDEALRARLAAVERDHAEKHAQVQGLLEQMSVLADQRDALRREIEDGLRGSDLLERALVDERAEQHLRAQTRGMHERLVGVQRYRESPDGEVMSFAPVLEVAGLDDPAGLADAGRAWLKVFRPRGAGPAARHEGRCLVDVWASGKRAWQVWVDAAGTGFAVDAASRTGRAAEEGSLEYLLTEISRGVRG